jgi:hypothetical protein
MDVPDDPLWQRARGEDRLERARLAEAVGAAALLDAVDGGGEAEAAALGALPYADDAEAALGALAERALVADPASRARLLEAILAIAGRPASPRDPLDPDGVRACARALLVLAARADLPRDDRALAVSAARALADKGFADPARVPADLDPP